jgi:hypothetical protein
VAQRAPGKSGEEFVLRDVRVRHAGAPGGVLGQVRPADLREKNGHQGPPAQQFDPAVPLLLTGANRLLEVEGKSDPA